MKLRKKNNVESKEALEPDVSNLQSAHLLDVEGSKRNAIYTPQLETFGVCTTLAYFSGVCLSQTYVDLVTYADHIQLGCPSIIAE